ncbi:MAG: MFS transporter [Thermogutta sp.]
MLNEKLLLRIRLCILMFFQFFVWACWMVPIGTFGPSVRGFTGSEMGWVFSTTAIAAIVSPLFVGFVADRLFDTEKILAVLHLIGGICLILTGVQTSFWLFFIFLLVNTLAFMPTLALANSLTFRNLDDPATFPRIAMFGTIGWIISGWIVGLFIGERSPAFFYLGGAVEILLAAYVLTLPHTPPQAKEAGIADLLGLGAVKLLKDPEFLLFTLCAFLIGIPAVYYFVSANLYLTQIGAPAPTALMTMGQVCEIVAMAIMPIFIAQLGLHKVLALGMAVWALRYLLFASEVYPLVLLGILVHGFCYVFVYVGSYIFVDTKAPRELRASGQSFIAFLMLGVAWLIGANLAGRTNDAYPAKVSTLMTARIIPEGVTLPSWNELAQDFDQNKDGIITSDEIQQALNNVPQGQKQEDRRKQFEALKAVMPLVPASTFGHVQAAVAGKSVYITKGDYLAVNRLGWRDIWLWPAIMALVVFALFTLGMPRKKESGAETTGGETSPPPAAPAETAASTPESEPATSGEAAASQSEPTPETPSEGASTPSDSGTSG